MTKKKLTSTTATQSPEEAAKQIHKIENSVLAAKPGADLGGGSDAKGTPAAENKGTEVDEIRGEVRIRRWVGGVIGALGIAVVIGVIVFATLQINNALLKNVAEGKEYLVVVAVAAHAIVSVASVWFGYQMLRAAERMFIPRRFLGEATDVEVLRALVGIDAPTTAVTEQLKGVTRELPKLVKELKDLAATVGKEKPPSID